MDSINHTNKSLSHIECKCSISRILATLVGHVAAGDTSCVYMRAYECVFYVYLCVCVYVCVCVCVYVCVCACTCVPTGLLTTHSFYSRLHVCES